MTSSDDEFNPPRVLKCPRSSKTSCSTHERDTGQCIFRNRTCCETHQARYCIDIDLASSRDVLQLRAAFPRRRALQR